MDEKKRIQEDYSQWKKTAPVLYDMVITHNLTWPTLTCQWLPTKERYIFFCRIDKKEEN